MKPVKIIQAITPTIAIVAIAILEAVAITHGINGVAFSGALILISGLGGYQAKKVKDQLTNGGKRSSIDPEKV